MTDERNEKMKETINTFRIGLLAESLSYLPGHDLPADPSGTFTIPMVVEGGCGGKKIEEMDEEDLDEMSAMGGGAIEGAMGGGAPADPEKPDYARKRSSKSMPGGFSLENLKKAATGESARLANRSDLEGVIRQKMEEELDFASGDKTDKLQPLLPLLQKVNPKLKHVLALRNAIEGNMVVMNATINDALDELESFASDNLDNKWAYALAKKINQMI